MIMRGYQFDALAYLRLMVFLSQLIYHSYICLQFNIPGTDTCAEMERRQFWKTTGQEVFASISMKQENSLKVDYKLILLLWNFNFLLVLDRYSNELHRKSYLTFILWTIADTFFYTVQRFPLRLSCNSHFFPSTHVILIHKKRIQIATVV